MRYVFGPVPSRRLGRSLGVDLVPFKTCTYDCVYCQLGRTTNKTVERKEYVPVEAVLDELEQRLAGAPSPDYVTLSGSGEPTLHAGMGRLIQGIKRMTSTPVAVLTNGSLLGLAGVQDDLREADLVLPSLDAGDMRLFKEVNRPHASLQFEQMVQGLVEFRRAWAKPIWLEVLLLAGVTGTEPEVRKIAELAARIAPDRVQLNTVVRPPAEEFALPVARETLDVFARLFTPCAEVIADRVLARSGSEAKLAGENILNLLERRPCTLEDLSEGLNLHPGEVLKHLSRLLREGRLAVRAEGSRVFYLLSRSEPGLSPREGRLGPSGS